MAEIKTLLDDVIEKEILELENLDGDEKDKAIQELTQLHKLRIEEIKAQTEEDNANNRLREGKIDRYWKTGVAAVELVLPLMFYGIWMGKGFKFEESGSFTSTTFKNLLNRFRPTK